jgi:uncharacterized membrane protein YfcA
VIDGFDSTAITASQAALSLLFGTMIGFLLGLVGGGGSILTVPILVYVIGLDVRAATATSLAIVGTSALAGAIPHAHAGRVNGHVALFFGLVGIAGAFAGTWLNHLVDGAWILLLFGVLMLVVAVRMWLRKASGLPARPGEDDPGAVWKVGVAGLLVGVMTGFFGVGGGFLIVPALALALGMPMAMAVGTSLLIIAINSASGIVAHLGTGGVDLPVALFFIGGGLVGAFLGGRLAGKIDERALSRAFSAMVAGIGVYLIVQNAVVVVGGLA